MAVRSCSDLSARYCLAMLPTNGSPRKIRESNEGNSVCENVKVVFTRK